MEFLSQTDTLFLALGALAFGMWALIRSGDTLVDAGSDLAKHFKIPTLLIGFTIIAFGTSLPELLVSVNANFKDSAGIALGNVIGSNVANILLVIGAAALVYPVIIERKEIKLDTIIMILATIVMTGILYFHIGVSRIAGFLMVAALFSYIFYQYSILSRSKHTLKTDAPNDTIGKNLLFVLIGLGGLALGAEILVRSSIILARMFDIPESVIGITIIALGTSLPELATSVIAAMKKESGIAVGNVLGSNVFNILLIVGLTGAIKPIPDNQITPNMANIDSLVMFGITLIFATILLTRGKFGRILGGVMLACYIGYIGILYIGY